MKKRILSLVLAGSLSLCLAAPALAAEEVDSSKTYPTVTVEGSEYVPLRAIAQDLGYAVTWDQTAQTAVLNDSLSALSLHPFTQEAEVSFVQGTLPVPMAVKDDTIYVDKSFFDDYAGAAVTLSGGNATVEADAGKATRDAIRANDYGVKESYAFTKEVLMLPMDDGVRLETIVWKPVGEGPWPTAFTRGPYGTADAIGEEYAKRGFAYVYQNCRGKGNSEGEYVANVDERRDGIASLNWLNEQSWVESIGMHGHSYLALTTWIVGDSLPEKVKALHVQCYGVLRNLSVSHSGLVAVDNITAWSLQNCTDKFTYDFYIDSAQYLPQIHVDTDLWGGKVEGYADWVDHPDFTDPYWNEGVWGDLKNAIGKIDVPTTIFGGYYDHHFEGTLEGWNLLSNETKAKSHLVLGSWNHGFGYASQWKGGENYTYNKDTDTFNWFYSILVNGQVPATGVDAYVVGDDEWVHLDSFPLESDGELTYYLTKEPTQSDGTAYLLSGEKASKGDTVSYVYDPTDPKWAEGGECFLNSNGSTNAESKYNVRDLRGSGPLSPAGHRDDVISFISDPVAQDVTLAGDLTANLFVSTDVEDTAFTYTISEVDPAGTAHNIRNGLLTLAYRNDRYASPVNDYKPGQVVELEIESLPIVWTVSAGNRIRVDISSSNFPEFSNHTNTVGNWAEQTETKIANQTIYIGGDHPSSITLPTLSQAH